jgi:hypothetical protein
MTACTPAPADVTRIESHVRARLGGRLRDFRVLPREDGVVLQGNAPTYYAKQLAQHAVMEVTPFRILANEIVVW